MKRGFTLIELMIVVAIAAILFALAMQFLRDYGNRDKMVESGCRVIGYAGSLADIRVYNCPGYDDVVTERNWQGPRVVEKQ